MNVKFNVNQTGNTATVDISVMGGVTGITRTRSAFVRRVIPRKSI